MRSFAVIVLTAYVSSCMEMHETIERTVMVRTTGSDLQPAATGFIYKKESDSPASVIKMGESEVMEHLSKMYEQPKSFAAPIPIVAGPFYVKTDEDKAVAISSESKVIPVVENHEDNTDHIDSSEDEDKEKTLDEYADFGKYKSDLDDYLKSLEHFTKLNHGEDRYDLYYHKKHENSGKNGYVSDNNFDNKNADNYSSGKYETYQTTNNDKNKENDGKAYEEHSTEGNGNKRFYRFQPRYSQDKAVNEYHQYFNSDEYKNDEGSQNRETFKGADEEIFNGPDYTANKYHKRGFGGNLYDKQLDTDPEKKGDKLSQQYLDEFTFESGKRDGRSYGYEIEH